MKGLVSAYFLCKLAYSIQAFILASPGFCHSPIFPLPSPQPGVRSSLLRPPRPSEILLSLGATNLLVLDVNLPLK